MDYQPEASTVERARSNPNIVQRQRPRSVAERGPGHRSTDDGSWRAARPTPGRLAVEHVARARQTTTFLWILAAALMRQSAALGAEGHGYSTAGLIVVASGMLLGFVSRRRIYETGYRLLRPGGTVGNRGVQPGVARCGARTPRPLRQRQRPRPCSSEVSLKRPALRRQGARVGLTSNSPPAPGASFSAPGRAVTHPPCAPALCLFFV